jgi:penicillin-binding protein 2
MIDREVGATFDRRSALFFIGGAALGAVLVARMLQLQLFQHKKYKRLSERNSYRTQIELPERGKILDRHGVPLAKDAPIYRIYVIPDEAEDPDALLDAISGSLNLKPDDIARIKRRIRRQRGFQPALIKESTDWDHLATVHMMNLNGLHIERGYSRRYPSGKAGAQSIGYTGASDAPAAGYQADAARSPFWTTGQTGLEKQFDETLSGAAGKTILVVDALGRITGDDPSQEVASIDGRNLTTTLVEPIQRKLYELLEPHQSGCGVVMEAETGHIVAMVSAPSFDANLMRGDDSADVVRALRNNPLKPFMNKAVEGLYPPGSTFKIVIALAALETGAINPATKVYCDGDWEYGSHLYHCWEKHGHGHVDMITALQKSCDIYFYQLALKLGIDAIYDMAIRLGFGQKLLDILPREMAGVIPSRAWKEKNIGQRWQHGDTIITSIGQGYVLANSLQLATMMARVATNKIIMPRLIADKDAAPNSYASLGLKQSNIDIVLKGLERVTQEGGTAWGSAINIRGQRMGGKTGTSQVRSISRVERLTGVRTNDQLPWHLRSHGLFVGFAPTTRPKYVAAAVTEHAGGSGAAARTVAGVMRDLLKGDK